LVAADANEKYLFADLVHPSGAGHKLYRDLFAAALQAPGTIALLAQAPQSGARALIHALDKRLSLNIAAVHPGRVEAWASYGHARQDLAQKQRATGFDSSLDSLSLGVDRALNQRTMVGLALGLGRNKTDFGQKAGHFKLDQTAISAYTQYQHGPCAMHALGMISSLDYKDVTRTFAVGHAQRKEVGETQGSQSLLRLGGQYNIALNNGVTLGPLADITWQNVKVKGYTEQGGRSTSMHFGEQQQTSWIASLGAQLQARFMLKNKVTVEPFVQIALEKTLSQRQDDVRTHIVNMPGSFTATVPYKKPEYMRASLGVKFGFAGAWSAWADYNGRFSHDGKAHLVAVGLKKVF
jgi:outer membrane lipase/esterase